MSPGDRFERHFDKLLSALLLVFSVSVFLFMWKYGASEQLLDKPWGLAMLFAGLLAGLIQGARMALRTNGNGNGNGAAATPPQKS